MVVKRVHNMDRLSLDSFHYWNRLSVDSPFVNGNHSTINSQPPLQVQPPAQYESPASLAGSNPSFFTPQQQHFFQRETQPEYNPSSDSDEMCKMNKRS